MTGRILKAPRSRNGTSGMFQRNGLQSGYGGQKLGMARPPSPPPLPDAALISYRGPTRYCNWVIKGKILQGAYPGSMDDRVHRKQLSALLKHGVTTFVCLQAEFDPYVTEMEWRHCQKLRPYFGDAVALVRQSHTGPPSVRLQQQVDQMQFVYFPIIDQNVAPDAELANLIQDLLDRVARGEVLYIHCWGGHGRAGTVAAILLGILENMTPRDALNRIQKLHDTRLETSEYGFKVESPQRPSQRAQVKRLTLAWQQKKENSADGITILEPEPLNIQGKGKSFPPSQRSDSVQNRRIIQQKPTTKNVTRSVGSVYKTISYDNGNRHSFEQSTSMKSQGAKDFPPSPVFHRNSMKERKKNPLSQSMVLGHSSRSPQTKKTSEPNPSLSLPPSYRLPKPSITPTNKRSGFGSYAGR